MKLSVRSKVANGLVICLLIPRVASTAVEMFEAPDDGLNAFAADDEFLLSPETGPIAMIRLQADPGGDPTACDDPSGAGILIVDGPSILVTTESNCDPSGGGLDPSGGGLDPSACVPFGNMKLIEVSMNPPPQWARTFYVEATDADPSGAPSDEASVSPEALVFDDDLACIPKSVWVTGENDNLNDGNQPYEVRISDEQDFVVDSIPGVNLDNDNYKGVAIDIQGPNSLPPNGVAVYTVHVINYSGGLLDGNNLVIEPSPGLAITNYAASLAPGGKFKSKGRIKSGVLTFERVDLNARDDLLVSLQVVLFDGGPIDQTITARFEKPSNGRQIDDDLTIRTSLP